MIVHSAPTARRNRTRRYAPINPVDPAAVDHGQRKKLQVCTRERFRRLFIADGITSQAAIPHDRQSMRPPTANQPSTLWVATGDRGAAF